MLVCARTIKGSVMFPTICNKQRVQVDRATLLEIQLEQLLLSGKVESIKSHFLTSKNYPSDSDRPSSVLLGECNLGRTITNYENPSELIAAVSGVVRCADPYELAGLIRDGAKSRLTESLPVLGQVINHSDSPLIKMAPFLSFSEILGTLSVSDIFMAGGWHDEWRFLVVCVE